MISSGDVSTQKEKAESGKKVELEEGSVTTQAATRATQLRPPIKGSFSETTSLQVT